MHIWRLCSSLGHPQCVFEHILDSVDIATFRQSLRVRRDVLEAVKGAPNSTLRIRISINSLGARFSNVVYKVWRDAVDGLAQILKLCFKRLEQMNMHKFEGFINYR